MRVSRPMWLAMFGPLLLAGCHEGRLHTGAERPPVENPVTGGGNAAALTVSTVGASGIIKRERAEALPFMQSLLANTEAYGRIEFSMEYFEEGLRQYQSFQGGSFPERLWEGLKRQFGSTTRSLLVTVQPIYQGSPLAELPLMMIEQTNPEGGGVSVRSTTNQTIATPWQRIGPLDQYTFTIRVRASTNVQPNVGQLFSTISEIAGGIGAGPTAGATTLVSRLSLPAFTAIANQVNLLAVNMYSAKVSDDYTGGLGPTSSPRPQTSNSFWSQERLIVSSDDGTPVLRLTAQLMHRPSLALPLASLTPAVPAATEGRKPAPALVHQVIYPVNGQGATALSQQNFNNHPILQTFRNAAGQRTGGEQVDRDASFRLLCGNARTYLQQIGLTQDDNTRVRYEVASLGGFELTSSYAADTECFTTEERTALAAMGVQITDKSRPPALPIADADLDGLVAALRRGEAEPSPLRDNMAGAVTLYAERGTLAERDIAAFDVSPAAALRSLASAKALYAGCYSRPGAALPAGTVSGALATGGARLRERTILFQPQFPGAYPAVVHLAQNEAGTRIERIRIIRVTEIQEIDVKCSASDESREYFRRAFLAAEAANPRPRS